MLWALLLYDAEIEVRSLLEELLAHTYPNPGRFPGS